METIFPDSPEFKDVLKKRNTMYEVMTLHVNKNGDVIVAFGKAFALLCQHGIDVAGLIAERIEIARKQMVKVN